MTAFLRNLEFDLSFQGTRGNSELRKIDTTLVYEDIIETLPALVPPLVPMVGADCNLVIQNGEYVMVPNVRTQPPYRARDSYLRGSQIPGSNKHYAIDCWSVWNPSDLAPQQNYWDPVPGQKIRKPSTVNVQAGIGGKRILLTKCSVPEIQLFISGFKPNLKQSISMSSIVKTDALANMVLRRIIFQYDTLTLL